MYTCIFLSNLAYTLAWKTVQERNQSSTVSKIYITHDIIVNMVAWKQGQSVVLLFVGRSKYLKYVHK